jgi:hypothetical protein
VKEAKEVRKKGCRAVNEVVKNRPYFTKEWAESGKEVGKEVGGFRESGRQMTRYQGGSGFT